MTDALTKNVASEGQAIALAQGGDAVAFEYLYKEYFRRVYSICLGMTRNPADAEDLTQQTFLQLFRKIGTFRGEANFSTWLHRVTVNVVLLHMRHRKPPAASVVEDLECCTASEEVNPKQGSGEASLSSLVDGLNLRRAIAKLSPGCKRQFLLYDLFGYKHSEIAEHLGCSVGSSKSQLHKARKRLRRLLQGKPARAEASVATA